MNSNRRALALAMAAAVTASPAAWAQDQSSQLESIVVTGTRIRATNGMVTPTPVTAVSVDELSSFEPGNTISEQLDALPQFFSTQTAQRGGGTLFGDAAGSYLNLRGMGKQRTLVLFDGSRMVPADRASSVNVDNFPTALVKSIDVVTGGASAAYGADALAGVVNFVLDREFEGLKTQVSAGETAMGDGQNWNFSVAGGHQVGNRLHLIGSVQARHIDQIDRDTHDLSNFKRWGFVTNPDWYPGAPAGIPQRLTRPWVSSTEFTSEGLINQPGFSLDRYTFTEDGENVRPFILGDLASVGGPGSTHTQAGGPYADISDKSFDSGVFGNEVIQHSVFGGIEYNINDRFQLFGQFMAGETKSESHHRPGNPHLQTDTWYGTVYVDNAFLPDVVRQAMIDEGLDSIRIDKLGQLQGPQYSNYYDDRSDSNVSEMWSGTIGLDIKLPHGWDLRTTYQGGNSKLTTSAHNIMRIDKFFLAMDAVRDPQTGAIVCNAQLHNPTPAQLAASMQGVLVPTTYQPGRVQPDSPVGPDNPIRDCIPLNVFGDGNASQAAADYIVGDKTGLRHLHQHFAEMLLTGDVYKGFGAGPLAFAGGLTWRSEGFGQYAIPIAMARGPANAPELGIRGISDGMAGGNRSLFLFSSTSVASGDFSVWEWFGELNIPIWESASRNQRLTTDVAYRSSDYSQTGRIDSWKLGADFNVVRDLRLRWTQSRDVREPTFSELFEIGGGGGNFNDPMFANANFETTVLIGGNPNLKPEKADTTTAGFVYSPTFAAWIDGLQFSVDWYKIDVKDAVGQLGQQRIVDECYESHIYCDLITRDPDSGIVQRIYNQNLNVAAALTSGVDLEVGYTGEPDFFSSQSESLSVRAFAGYLAENSTTPQAGRKQDAAGGLSRPEWTGVVTANYNVGPYGIRLQQRYYDSTLIDVDWVEGVDVDDNTIDSQSITNLAFSYGRDTESGATWRATFNITNLFDQEPPVVPSISQRFGTQTVSTNFDTFGRRYQVSLNYSF